jgi:hypothetical protein
VGARSCTLPLTLSPDRVGSRAGELFDNIEEELEFAEEYDFDVARAEILENQGRLGEAADLHAEEGRTLKAIDLYLRDESSDECLEKAQTSLLAELWKEFSFGAVPDPTDKAHSQQLRDLFALVDRVVMVPKTDPQSQLTRREVGVFRAIYENAHARLREQAEQLVSVDKRLQLLCLDHAFRSTNKLLEGNGQQVVQTLQTYHAYARLMQELIFHNQPWNSLYLRVFFAITLTDDGEIQLQDRTFLFQSFIRYNRLDPAATAPPSLDVLAFLSLYRRALSEKLRVSIESINEHCLQVRVLEPCQWKATGSCATLQCMYNHDLDVAWFNLSLRFYFYQGFILNIHQTIVKTSSPTLGTSQQLIRYVHAIHVNSYSHLL